MKDTAMQKTAYKVSAVTIVVNLVLSVFKLIAGIVANSGAMISDAVHSASDVLSTFVVIVGVKISAKDSDETHPYGHERFECISAIILSGLLLATGIGIGYSGVKNIISGGEALKTPGVLALIAAVVSIVVKEAMYHYTMRAAKTINSGALKADAWHHRSDALSSVGSFAGIFGARLGIKVLDPIASVIICILIAKAAVDIFIDSVNKMTDRSCDEKTVEEIKQVASSQAGVISVDLLKTRLFGDKIYVDIEIGADKSLTLEQAHEIAERTHDAIESWSENVKHCMVHVNPADLTDNADTSDENEDENRAENENSD